LDPIVGSAWPSRTLTFSTTPIATQTKEFIKIVLIDARAVALGTLVKDRMPEVEKLKERGVHTGTKEGVVGEKVQVSLAIDCEDLLKACLAGGKQESKDEE
jgi:hypothetical protein